MTTATLAPLPVKADPRLVEKLRTAALKCVKTPQCCESKSCHLLKAVPHGSGYDPATRAAVAVIIGQRLSSGASRDSAQMKAAYLRSQLRRWAVRAILTGAMP